MQSDNWYPIWVRGYYIPPSHQLPPAPVEIERDLPGWKEMEMPDLITAALDEIAPVIEETPATDAKKRRPWIMALFKGNEKTGYTYYPPWMRQLEPPKLQPGPVARIDREIEATVKRLTADIQKTASSLNDYHRDKLADQIGKKAGKHYGCVTTDHHRALLVRDAFSETRSKGRWPLGPVPKAKDPHFVLEDPEIMNGVRRLERITHGESLQWVQFDLCAAEHRLTITSSFGEEIEGEEVYDAESTSDFRICFDPTYLLPLFGTWPIVCYFTDERTFVAFMPKTKAREFMYVLMPVDRTKGY